MDRGGWIFIRCFSGDANANEMSALTARQFQEEGGQGEEEGNVGVRGYTYELIFSYYIAVLSKA
jgi:hypothetical protein